ncbi:hypothetical protein [Pontibacter litorisediminis]|uniref:hypothetical protein n=1 Tax=Pontibacter litorisediminis TaxID=1846260 RepID=UPI0023EC732B|nr:hypothetical protein [Pontibacter litorisediminis]
MEEIIHKSGVNKQFLLFRIGGFLLCSAFVLLITSQTKVYDLTYALLVGFFAFFGFWSLLDSFRMKQLILTDRRLIYKSPILPVYLEVYLENISKIKEEDYEVSAKHESTTYQVHRGRKATVLTKEAGEVLSFNSYETADYYILINRLKAVTKKLPEGFVGDPEQYGKFEQKLFGSSGMYWLIMLIFLTAFLFYLAWKITAG